jgi:hypothetical protein
MLKSNCFRNIIIKIIIYEVKHMIYYKNDKFNIRLSFYLFLSFTFIVLLSDYITYLLNPNYLISLLFGLFGFITLNYLFRKHFKIVFQFDKSDLIFFIILFILLIITIPFADNSWDTLNYHLYVQEKPFFDKINFDLFAGRNINSFTYAFSDRLYYLFRYFLGYRLGLLFNYFLMIIVYFQTKKIISEIINEKVSNNYKYNVISSIIATFSILSLSIIEILDGYYVDLLSIVLLLEIINLFFFDTNIEYCKKNINIIIYPLIGYLFGICFAVKFSNAFPIIFLFVLFVIKNRKQFIKSLSIKAIIITGLAFVFPFIVYLIYTFIQTGNPFFPFYNGLFKSKYFMDYNWVDNVYGPKRKFEIFIWPFISMIDVSRCTDKFIFEPSWFFGYVISFLYLINYIICIIKKINYNKKKMLLMFLVICLNIIWAKFMIGYSRYALVVLILCNIVFLISLFDSLKYKKPIITGIIIILIIINSNYSFNYIFNNKNTWIINNLFNNEITDYKYGIKNIISNNNIKFEPENNSAWAIFDCNSGYAQQINSNLPIINMTNSIANNYTKELFNNRVNKYDHLYTVADGRDFNTYIRMMDNQKYKISKIIGVYSNNIISSSNHYFYIFEVNKCINDCNIELSHFEKEKEIELNSNSTLLISVPGSFKNHYKDTFKVNILNNDVLLHSFNIDINGQFEIVDFNNLVNPSKIKIQLEDVNAETNEGLWIQYILIND